MRVVIDSEEWDAGHNMHMKKIDISGQKNNNEKKLKLVHIKSSLVSLAILDFKENIYS